MADKVHFSGIWTTFDAYIILYHNEDISGFRDALSHILTPPSRSPNRETVQTRSDTTECGA